MNDPLERMIRARRVLIAFSNPAPGQVCFNYFTLKRKRKQYRRQLF